MTVTINGTTGLAGTNGSAGTPAVQGEDTNTGLFFPAADTVAVATGGSERLRVDSSGNVGIGTTSPASLFDIRGSSNGQNVLQLSNSAGTNDGGAENQIRVTCNGNTNWGNLDIQTFTTIFTNNNIERMRIDSSGNVGIGTTSPSNSLHVQKEITTAYSSSNTLAAAPLAYFYNTNGSVGGAGTIRLDGGASGGNAAISISAVQTATGSSALTFGTRNGGSDVTERARIDASGNLLVGTTGLGTGRIQVLGPSGSNDLMLLRTSTSFGNVIFQNSSGVQVGYIQSSGSATSYVTSSDYRLKENVQPMTGALDAISQLNPVTYTWKADGSAGQGFIAHELQAVVPDCVTGEKDAVDAEGNPQYQGVDTSFLVATLVKAIQELTARVAQLEAQ